MTNVRRIDETISVAPQISPEDIPALAAAGFGFIINNRPEGEESGQPSNVAIRAAAEAAGMGYAEIPTVMGGMTQAQVNEMAAALASAGKPVLAFCRSGTRSCNLWALAEASKGGDPETLIAKGAAAGYDLSGIRPVLDQLSARA
ncbi:TIGR01244 family sulfur transferase [Sphingomonas soli]|uniref:TIGR01244 family sulfur transferase n=1 Tax=Sphingomonas soli TaxID=266127 RepID=UPI0008348047|nr:TIGR01244 family sulfur transferase [Sphingomonas soli]